MAAEEEFTWRTHRSASQMRFPRRGGSRFSASQLVCRGAPAGLRLISSSSSPAALCGSPSNIWTRLQLQVQLTDPVQRRLRFTYFSLRGNQVIKSFTCMLLTAQSQRCVQKGDELNWILLVPHRKVRFPPWCPGHCRS